jgi:hypothetical protein
MIEIKAFNGRVIELVFVFGVVCVEAFVGIDGFMV